MKKTNINIARYVIISFVLLVSLRINLISQSESATLENVLSVYIYNFSKYIEWPPSQSDKFNICIWGENKIISPLEVIAKKETVNGNEIEVKELNKLNEIEKCNILFYPGNNIRVFSRLIDFANEKAILLITNSEGFAEKGAGINFIKVEDKIKFEINKRVLEKNKLIPNSRLLSLAVNVYE